MKDEIEAAGRRYAVFSQSVLEPRIYSQALPLEASAYQCADPIPFSAAVAQTYQPVALGWRWGPVWSTAWFRLSGRVPVEMKGRSVVLRFSCGTEALLWDAGAPRQGFGPNHGTALLYGPAAGRERVELYVEAACNRPLGATFFWWDAPVLRERWQQPDPGRLNLCELAVYEPAFWRLWCTYEFARQLLLLYAEDSARGRQLWAALEQVTTHLGGPRGGADAAAEATVAQAVLEQALHGSPPTRTRCLANGHAHIDTAWLWTLRETRRKCLRTLASALALMEQYPDFRFLCSQAQQYAWVQAQEPGRRRSDVGRM
jgi:alpha-mannosidase